MHVHMHRNIREYAMKLYLNILPVISSRQVVKQLLYILYWIYKGKLNILINNNIIAATHAN